MVAAVLFDTVRTLLALISTLFILEWLSALRHEIMFIWRGKVDTFKCCFLGARVSEPLQSRWYGRSAELLSALMRLCSVHYYGKSP